jgi:hypothetical protein
LPDFRCRRRRHLHPDDKNNAGGASLDRPYALMYCGRAGGTGIFNASRWLEAEVWRGLQDQRGGKILR